MLDRVKTAEELGLNAEEVREIDNPTLRLMKVVSREKDGPIKRVAGHLLARIWIHGIESMLKDARKYAEKKAKEDKANGRRR